MFTLEGIYPAMLTPFDEDRSINYEELSKLVNFYLTCGLHGLFPVSSVGEAICMNFEEKKQYMKTVVSAAKGQLPVTPGIASDNPAECIELSEYAHSLGCPAIVVTPPYYYKPTEKSVDEFFIHILEHSPIPVILYNIPLFTQPLSYSTIAKLTAHKQVVGMKDSSGSMVDFLHFQDIMHKNASHASLFTGREDMLLPSLLMDGKGCMTAAAAVFPEIMVTIWNHFKNNEIEKAKKLQRLILEPIRLMFSVPLPAGFKLGLEIRGFAMGPTRLPMAGEDTASLIQVKPLLKDLLGEILAQCGAKLLVSP